MAGSADNPETGRDEGARSNRSLPDEISAAEGWERALALGGVGTWCIDLTTQRMAIDQTEARLLGLDEGVREVSLQKMYDRIHPDDRDRVIEVYAEARRGRDKVQVEHRFVFENGRTFWVAAHGTVERDQAGEVARIYGIHVDVTERKKLDRRLERLEHWRLLSVEAAEVGDWEYDVVAQRAYWSPKALEQMGLDEPIEAFVDGIVPIHEDDRQEVLDAIDRALDADLDDDVYQAEFRLVHQDGRVVWVESRGHAIFEDTGRGRRPLRLIGAMVDVTERKRAEEDLRENRRRLATLMSNLPGMAYRCYNEPSWPMSFVSRGCEGLCGYSPDDLVEGRVSWEQLIHPADRQWVWDVVQDAVDDRERFEVEYRIEHADGSQHWVWEQGCGVFDEEDDDQPLALEGFITDITARKEAERELRRMDRRKNQFLAMLGHELRNPLMAISSAAELLAEVDEKLPLIERTQRIVSRQSRQMGRLIDGLLDLSRVTRGKLRLETECVDLAGVVEDLLEDRHRQLAERQVDLRVAPDLATPMVEADRVRIAQVIDNLLSNAIRFTAPGDRIEIELGAVGDCLELRVRDTGEGIDESFIDHIFEPFQQGVPSGANVSGGLGLGLALARQIIELHGGQIEAQSKGPGQGAEFVVRLPACTEGESTRHMAPHTAATARRLLVVEDNADIAELLSLHLEQLGLEVNTASTAGEGLTMARSDSFDAVLCDLGLPDIDGFEFARRLRSSLPEDQLPLIALTGFGDARSKDRAREAGFDDYLIKPVEVDNLLEVLDRVID